MEEGSFPQSMKILQNRKLPPPSQRFLNLTRAMLGISNVCYLTVPARHRKQPSPQLPPQTQTEKGKAEPGNRVKQVPHKIPGHWGGNVPEGGNCVPMEILLRSLGSAAEQ